MKRVAVVGVGQLPFQSRYADKTYLSLAYEATSRALLDAKLTVRDLDAVPRPLSWPLRKKPGQLLRHLFG